MTANTDDNNKNDLLTFLNDNGFAIIPLPDRSKGPTLPGWQKRTPADNNLPELVKHPGNFGLVLGAASGEVVDIDLDCPEAVVAADHLLPETGWSFGRKTNPRSHRLYRLTDGAGKIQRINDENGRRVIEYLANGAQCVCPPSLHDETGEQIAFETPIGELGETTRDELLRAVQSIQMVVVLANNYKKDNRQDIIGALTGTLLQAGQHSDDDIRKLVEALCLITKDEEYEKRLKDGVDRTIQKKDDNKPFTQGRELQRLIGEKAFKAVKAFLSPRRVRRSSGGTSPAMRGDFKRRYENTDEELAKSFKEQASGRVIYVPEIDSFYHYSDGIWTPDPKGLGTRREFSVFLKARIDLANKEDWDIQLKPLLKYKNHQHAMNVVKDFRSFAQSVSVSQLDNHDDALPVKNGLFNFKSNQLEPYRPDHYITKRSDIIYDASADCPKFRRFLQDIFCEDDELIAYMKIIMGYWITGETDRQEFYVLHGDRKNGKSTLVNILEGVMGSLFGTIMAATLFDNQNNLTALSDLACLQGKRLVIAAEAEAEGDGTARLNASRIKMLSGGDVMRACYKHKNPFDFRPKCKNLFICNELPTINVNDGGLRRRIIKIPFDYTVPEETRVLDYHKVLLAEEGPGILNYLLEGVQEYLRLRNTLRVPKVVRVATENYFAGQNILKQYLDSGLVRKGPGRVPKAAFYEGFIEYCKDEMIEPVGKKHFSQAMLKLGYKEERTATAAYWKGIDLATPENRVCGEEDEDEKVYNLADFVARS